MDCADSAKQEFWLRIFSQISGCACAKHTIHSGIIRRCRKRDNSNFGVLCDQTTGCFHPVDAAGHEQIEHNDMGPCPARKFL
jgi:hypothetical protein